MKRYKFGSYALESIAESSEGEWVRYEDVKFLIDALSTIDLMDGSTLWPQNETVTAAANIARRALEK